MTDKKVKPKWLYVAPRMTSRVYPSHGSSCVMEGKLRGSSSTDYFHLHCSCCGSELDRELLGVRLDSRPDGHKTPTIVLGLSCRGCTFCDLIKISCLSTDGEYMCRRSDL